MSSHLHRLGGRVVEVLAIQLVGLSVGAAAITILWGGTSQVPVNIGRVLVAAALAKALLSGKVWARWLVAVLTTIATASYLKLALEDGMPALGRFLLVAFALGYAFIALTLLANDSAVAFFAAHANNRAERPGEV